MYYKELQSTFMLGVILALLAGAFGIYNMYRNSTTLDTDKTTINTLSSFTVKNNPNAEKDYERLAAYQPKTDEGENFKTEKVTQKLNELNAFNTK